VDGEVIVGGVPAGLIIIENGVAAVEPTEFVAVTLIVEVPAVVGVPLRTPAEENVKPAGVVSALQVIGVVPAPWNG
jgi:hypothetical protein